MHMTILEWKEFVIKEYDYLLDQLTDSYRQEVIHGHFRIEKGMHTFDAMLPEYKELYALYQAGL